MRATAHQVWDHTAAPAQVGDCDRTIRSEAVRDVRFRTTRPATLHVAGGRVLAADVRRLAGTVVLAGANTVSERCGPQGRETIQDCVRSRRSFSGAVVGIVGARNGAITVRTPRRVRLRKVNCPVEPPELLPLGPLPVFRVSSSTLSNARNAQITLTASKTRRTTYSDPESGTLEERSAWTLTLTRG